jgi:mannose-6-phosphate isomerase-like protein (cupin superfamily)
MEIKIIKDHESKPFMEGDEYCKLYFDTDKIVFGVSTLHPSCKGEIDPGHESAYEIFYAIKGNILCYIPTENNYYKLNEGDAILIPPKKPHQLINVGNTAAIVSWSQAKF